MNRDVMKGKWMQMKGEMKQWWGRLTDDEIDRLEGDKDKLVGLLQEKYGYTREKAEEEVSRRMREFERPETMRR